MTTMNQPDGRPSVEVHVPAATDVRDLALRAVLVALRAADGATVDRADLYRAFNQALTTEATVGVPAQLLQATGQLDTEELFLAAVRNARICGMVESRFPGRYRLTPAGKIAAAGAMLAEPRDEDPPHVGTQDPWTADSIRAADQAVRYLHTDPDEWAAASASPEERRTAAIVHAVLSLRPLLQRVADALENLEGRP